MSSLLLDCNGRLLITIIALLFVNVPVAEAKPNWPEGTKRNFTILIVTAMIIALGVAGAIVYSYRTVVSRRAIPSDEETISQIRQSREWLEYTSCIRAGHRNGHQLEEAAVARILELERQLFEIPSRPLLCRIFNCLFPSKLFSRLFRDTKNRSTQISREKSISENSLDKGKTPEPPVHSSQPHFSAADGAGPATSVRSDGKVATPHSISSAKFARSSRISNAHGIKKSATIKDCRKFATRKSISSIEFARPTGKSAANRTKYATTKDSRENMTHDSASSAKSALPYKKSTLIGPNPRPAPIKT